MQRSLVVLAKLALAVCLIGAAHAQYPSRPVRIIIPFPPGGGTEQATRILANHLSASLGQPFIIEPRPGANTILGAEAAARSPADGYTLFVCAASTMAINPSLFPRLPYGPKDFVAVGRFSAFPFFLVVSSESPARSLHDLLDLAKTKPGALAYASAGNGTAGHLGFELLKRSSGADLVHVPYKSYTVAMPDLLAGRVTAMMADLAVVGGALRAGKLRALATTGAQRSHFMPEVPSISESGIHGFELTVWFGLFAPAGTPGDVVRRLNAEMTRFLSSQDAKESYRKIGHQASASTPEELTLAVSLEAEKWGKVIREARIQPD